MDAYIYRAALYCAPCGERIRKELTDQGKAPADPDNEYSYDSDAFPKGPLEKGGGEADTPQHCDSCELFLENPLTTAGQQCLREQVADVKHRIATVRLWAEFYDLSPFDVAL